VFDVTIQGADQVFLMGSGSPDPGSGKVQPLSAPFSSCPLSGAKPTFKLNCTLSRMRAGDSGSVTFAPRKEFSSTEFTQSSTTISWQVSSQSTPDPNGQNNFRSVDIVWCGTQATDPGCADAG
jgi:hypothetical protein